MGKPPCKTFRGVFDYNRFFAFVMELLHSGKLVPFRSLVLP